MFLLDAKFRSKIKGLVDSKARRIRLKSTSNFTEIRREFLPRLLQILSFSKSLAAIGWLVSRQKINAGRHGAISVTLRSSCRLRGFGALLTLGTPDSPANGAF
ncbi:hypothetical protein ACIQUB_07470 [Rhizobium sp. NPDC090275]|uniref:hypothetical protein n=1 Tax=Rhizobium sp. NPDC090275 TaxID=3364498 RepID=UPI0013AFE62E